VLAARPVATLAGFGIPAAFLIGFHHLVRVLLEGVEDILVTGLAGGGADELRRLVIRGWSSGSGGGAGACLYLLAQIPRGQGDRDIGGGGVRLPARASADNLVPGHRQHRIAQVHYDSVGTFAQDFA